MAWRSSKPLVHKLQLSFLALAVNSASSAFHWILGPQGSNCDDVCAYLEMECNRAELKAVNTEAEILDAAAQAGAYCDSPKGAAQSWAYDVSPAVCTDKDCCGDGSCQGICSFGYMKDRSCAASGRTYSRLCPCEPHSTTSTTVTTTSSTVKTTTTTTTRRKKFVVKDLSEAAWDDAVMVDSQSGTSPISVFVLFALIGAFGVVVWHLLRRSNEPLTFTVEKAMTRVRLFCRGMKSQVVTKEVVRTEASVDMEEL
eukprot:gnl/TRDRNA2_/TRDRNA2_140357_c0_seq1.p1 gnl/TRDRNA2_/TRDRNA2_140357_c0~~gnl/TRDRNA2_/TRDRNA2_140357_c0_seq1.p1  ORF type:complete len:255 (+),score=35.23 gnl/TRDRNA2_/TRDRNA2_140357_c0_seq1:87-851(+)